MAQRTLFPGDLLDEYAEEQEEARVAAEDAKKEATKKKVAISAEVVAETVAGTVAGTVGGVLIGGRAAAAAAAAGESKDHSGGVTGRSGVGDETKDKCGAAVYSATTTIAAAAPRPPPARLGPQRRAPASFNISRGNDAIARVTLHSDGCAPGSMVGGTIDFSAGDVPCCQVCVALEVHEQGHRPPAGGEASGGAIGALGEAASAAGGGGSSGSAEPVKAEKAKKAEKAVTAIVATHYEDTRGVRLTSFTLTIPRGAPPTMRVLDLMTVEWGLRFEFRTEKLKLELPSPLPSLPPLSPGAPLSPLSAREGGGGGKGGENGTAAAAAQHGGGAGVGVGATKVPPVWQRWAHGVLVPGALVTPMDILRWNVPIIVGLPASATQVATAVWRQEHAARPVHGDAHSNGNGAGVQSIVRGNGSAPPPRRARGASLLETVCHVLDGNCGPSMAAPVRTWKIK